MAKNRQAAVVEPDQELRQQIEETLDARVDALDEKLRDELDLRFEALNEEIAVGLDNLQEAIVGTNSWIDRIGYALGIEGPSPHEPRSHVLLDVQNAICGIQIALEPQFREKAFEIFDRQHEYSAKQAYEYESGKRTIGDGEDRTLALNVRAASAVYELGLEVNLARKFWKEWYVERGYRFLGELK